jgi:AcrR family transcriptional regulator
MCKAGQAQDHRNRYKQEVPAGPQDDEPRSSLRAEQVAQTRSALVEAGRRLFGRQGFAATSVDDLAREARLTTGALYHHFPTKTALFETVFESVHADLLEDSMRAGIGADNEVEFIARGLESFLDAVLDPEVARIIVTDAPAVLGLERFTELDERYAFGPLVAGLEAAKSTGALIVDYPETLARLLFGALTRGAMLIASSADPKSTRQAVATTVRALLTGLGAT